jgi:hypothetical protein
MSRAMAVPARLALFGFAVFLLSARTPRAMEVSGTKVAARTDKVIQAIDWSSSLSAVKERAQKEKKLVFWLQLVGELDGGL